MGFSVPIFSKPKKNYLDRFVSRLRNKQTNSVSGQNIPVPDWVDKYDGFTLTSYKYGVTIDGYNSTVAIYWNDGMTSGFARIYLIDKDGKPYANTDKILKEMEYRESVHPVGYWVVDGKFYDFYEYKKNNFRPPSDIEIQDSIVSMSRMKEVWEKFPMAPDYSTLEKLAQAHFDVCAMLSEEKHGFARKNMENLREKIKDLQGQLEQIDKNLNVMYEKAADGMNLLEEYGIVVNLDDEPKEPEKIAVDCDISNLYPNSILKYIGAATIMWKPDCSYNVTPKDLKYNPNSGDMVRDTGNGLTAVYSYGKWEVMNP